MGKVGKKLLVKFSHDEGRIVRASLEYAVKEAEGAAEHREGEPKTAALQVAEIARSALVKLNNARVKE